MLCLTIRVIKNMIQMFVIHIGQGKKRETLLCGTYSVLRTPKTQVEFAGAYQYLIPWCSPDEKDVEDEEDERLGWHGGCQARSSSSG